MTELLDFIKFQDLNCLQEQLVELGKCPFCKTKLVFNFEVGDFCKSYTCPECDETFWI